MTPPIDPCRFPDFADKRVVDRHLDRLDTKGVSRRDFLSLASAGAAAAAGAAAMGLPSVALAAPGGKLAYLSFNVNEYNVQVSKTLQAATKAFGLSYIFLDGQSDGQRQVNQFEEQSVAGAFGAVLNLADGSSIRRIAGIAQENKTYFGNVWNTLPWFTPFDANNYYSLYAVPGEFAAHRAVTAELLKAVSEKFGGGKIIAVTGIDGYVTDLARSRGREDAFKDFPKTQLVDHLPGKWNREDALKATDDLLTRNKDIVGIVGQNDDIAQGILASLRARGLKAGDEILVTGADATSEAVKAVASGAQLATSANSPAYAAALFTANLYDVSHGWTPRAPERALNWRSLILTRDNVAAHRKRFVDNGDVEPFDYRKISKVLHPQDWDPQADVYPLDFELEWTGIPKPAGYTLPKAYTDARANGEFEKVKAEYADHYKIKFDGPSPNA